MLQDVTAFIMVERDPMGASCVTLSFVRLMLSQTDYHQQKMRAYYQAALWKLALYARPEMPSTNCHGWIVENGDIRIDWMDQLLTPLFMLEYIRCRCTANCSLVDARAGPIVFRLVQMIACVATSVKIK